MLPPAPGGYKLEAEFVQDSPTNPLVIYSVAIRALFFLAGQPWDGQPNMEDIGEKGFISFTLNNRKGMIDMVVQSKPMLKTEYFIRAIVILLGYMRQRKPGFLTVDSGILINEKLVGRVVMGSTVFSGQDLNETSEVINVTKSSLPLGSTNSLVRPATNTKPPPMWNRVDTYFPGMTLRWRSDGKSVPSQEILSMFVDGLTETAQRDRRTYCDWTYAVGASGTVAFHLRSVRPAPSMHGDPAFTWAYASMTIITLTEKVVVPLKAYNEMEFEFWDRDLRLAEGYILKVESNGLGNDNATASS